MSSKGLRARCTVTHGTAACAYRAVAEAEIARGGVCLRLLESIRFYRCAEREDGGKRADQ